MAPDPALLVAAATAALKAGRGAEACALMAQVAQACGDNADMLHMAALVHCLQQRHAEGLPWLRRAWALDDTRPDILANLARATFRTGCLDEALDCHDRLEARSWAGAPERLDHIAVLAAAGKHDEALARAAREAMRDPDSAFTWLAWGNALAACRLHEPALFALTRAIELDSQSALAWTGKAVVLHQLQRYEDALSHHMQALQLAPDNGGAWANLASTLKQMEKPQDALQCCERALALLPLPSAAELAAAATRPDSLTYLCVLAHQAHLLRQLRRNEEAVQAFARLASLVPEHAGTRSMLLFMRRMVCDWSEDAQLLHGTLQSIGGKDSLFPPFVIMGVVDDPGLQKRAIETVARELPRPARTAVFAGRRAPRIRLAYVSGDFFHHATAYLMNRFFAMHDRRRFEVFGVSLSRAAADDMTAQLRPQFDHFIEAGREPDAELAQRLRALELDIAIDLKGYTHDGRPGVFAERIAPLQINWLGFPATSGAADMDVILADRHIIPESARRHYTEEVAWVDGCYQCNDDQRPIATHSPARSELGLPENGFVYCCHNAGWKFTPEVFSAWMRILRAVPGSVLWLLHENQTAQQNLGREAQARGINPARLVFAPRVSHECHLARLSRADLFLDTLPCNAHTTASDALWAGLPLLTCTGRSFAGRVATSLLHAVGLPQLVCSSLEDYEKRAIALASNARAELASITRKLRTEGKRSRLFDTRRTCREVERVYLRLLKDRGLLAGREHLAAQAEQETGAETLLQSTAS